MTNLSILEKIQHNICIYVCITNIIFANTYRPVTEIDYVKGKCQENV